MYKPLEAKQGLMGRKAGLSRELHFTAEQPDKPYLASVGNSLEGRKFTHPWQPTKLNGWRIVCVSVSRHHIKAGNDVPADQWLVLEPNQPGHNT